MLQWTDPTTGKRRSKSSGTSDPDEAEKARADLEYELNHGLHKGTSRMSWEKFRERFEEEYVTGKRVATQRVYANVLNLFEDICQPRTLAGISERTLSAFAAGLRKKPGNGGNTMLPSTIHARLQFLHTVLAWAVKQKY